MFSLHAICYVPVLNLQLRTGFTSMADILNEQHQDMAARVRLQGLFTPILMHFA